MDPNLKLLVVEDEPLISFLFQDILDGTEFSVDAVMTCSGPVLRHISANVPDVAVVDLILEDGPCVAVIERLQALGVPTVIVSGHENAQELAARTGSPFLPKPFQSDVLLATLRAMVHPSRDNRMADSRAANEL